MFAAGSNERATCTLFSHSHKFCICCRFRFINGSTALHTAAYFGVVPIVRDLLALGIDINLLDYKGATALHRAKDVQTMQARQLCKISFFILAVKDFVAIIYIHVHMKFDVRCTI